MSDEDDEYLAAIRELEPIDVLLHWAREREAVRERKESIRPGGAFPWTMDPIIRGWRFCNVRREDDRVTQWIAKNIRERYAGHPYLWFMLCTARMINWPATIEDLMCTRIMDGEGWPDDPEFSPDKMGVILEGRARRLEKVFGGAYIIPAPQNGGNKGRFIAERVLGNLWKDRAVFVEYFTGFPRGYGPTLNLTHARLKRYSYWGDFLAYQAVVDMRFTPLLNGANDIHTWCAAGPGTIRGLNRLHDRPVARSLGQEPALYECRALWAILKSEGIATDFSDVPNVLCEFDKYSRVLHGEGEPRARYVPGRGS